MTSSLRKQSLSSNRPLSPRMVGAGCKLHRGDKTPGMVVGGGESGASRPIPLLPNQPVDGVISMPHMRQEIYSIMSSPHYAQKLWVNSQLPWIKTPARSFRRSEAACPDPSGTEKSIDKFSSLLFITKHLKSYI